MGRLTTRVLLNDPRFTVVLVNERIGGADMAAYLLEFDSTHGRFSQTCVQTEKLDGIVIGGNTIVKYTKFTNPQDIPWMENDVDLVFECTGAFLTPESIEGHFLRGAKRVVVSAPVDKGDVLNVVMGCNDGLITKDMKIVTAASCTTNCAAPVIGAIDKEFGVELGTICTVHNVTPTQTIMDVPNPGKKNDLRRARSGAVNLAPTTTGSAKAITMIFPHLKGKLDGVAVRVPCQNASITDINLLLKTNVTKDQINACLKKASVANPGVLGYETRPLVSTDYTNDPRSSIVDALSTQVVAGKLIKVLAWYDNEWGYVNRMVDIGKRVMDLMPPAAVASKL